MIAGCILYYLFVSTHCQFVSPIGTEDFGPQPRRRPFSVFEMFYVGLSLNLFHNSRFVESTAANVHLSTLGALLIQKLSDSTSVPVVSGPDLQARREGLPRGRFGGRPRPTSLDNRIDLVHRIPWWRIRYLGIRTY